MVNKPTVISTFAGIGGSSLGYKLAGFKELLAIDFSKNAYENFKLNFPNIPFLLKDIKQVTSKEIFEITKIKKGELDILDGSPPCQGFSIAGKKDVNDNRNTLFLEYVRLIKGLKPKIFIMENVAGMIIGNMKQIFIEILMILKSLNYNVKVKLLNAANYGVPQSRKRLFFIGVRKDLNFEPVFPKKQNKIITVEKALKGLKNSKKELKEAQIKDKIILNNYDKVKKGKSFASVLNGSRFNIIRLNNKSVSPTITKVRTTIHWSEKRYLTISEIKRLSSFPDNFILVGSVYNRWAGIGNAVMPLQMKAIAETLKKEILERCYR